MLKAYRVWGRIRDDDPGPYVRKILVNKATSEGLEAGRMAIVEDGEAGRHVIVKTDAVALIREADAEAVRFANA